MQSKAAYIDIELLSLPAPTGGNLPFIVAEELSKFSMQLQKHIDGGSQICPFQKDFHELATQFRQSLAKTKPILKLREFPPLPTRETPNGSTAGTPCPVSRSRGYQDTSFVVDISDDEDTPSPVVQRSGKKRVNGSILESPSKVQKMETPLSHLSSRQTTQSRCFTLPEVRKIIQRGYISLPGQVDPKAIEELISQSMEHWNKPLEAFFVQVATLCKNTVLQQVESVFGHRQQTRYYDEILEVCDFFLEEACAEQFKIAERLLSWELSKPTTLDERTMELARTAATNLLLSQRRKILAERFLSEQEEKSGKRSGGPLRDEKLAKVPDDELTVETFGPELKAMAVSLRHAPQADEYLTNEYIKETKAYYEVALSRFVDYLCLSIQCELFMKCRENIVPTLKQKFGVLEADGKIQITTLSYARN